MNTNKVKKEIEYPDAPSGFVNFYNYKEPLIPFPDGYGYLGALLFDGEKDTVQCHLCGEWHVSLGAHLHKEHNMRVSQYKDHVGLLQTTALIGDKFRAKLIASGLKARLSNLRPGGKHSEETKEKIRQTALKNAQNSEQQNLRGSCPAQLLDRIHRRYVELGRTPTDKELGIWNGSIKRVFGTVKNAFDLAGVPYRKPGTTLKPANLKHTREICVDWVADYYATHKVLPTFRKTRTLGKAGLWCAIDRYGRKEIFTDALKKDGVYKKMDRKFSRKISYSREDLIDFLKSFEKINGRKPAISDCKRGLLPHASRYYYYFGKWNNALKLAFPI